ncbi:hypothetical protein EZV62_009274 [Acer yangbiense]|uniref:Uncharacterized protein n=1 Tax=Acer yangbiense TaxID=1000413 RepID=A0A5C7IG68_9ROSI|nr:hypothetical protein EZV62_009274 [Acer yangbiense]
MFLKVDLECYKCYKKVKRILCKFPPGYFRTLFSVLPAAWEPWHPGVLALGLDNPEVSCSTSSKTASAFGSIRPVKSTLDKGKSVLKVQKVSAPKEKEPPALSDADVVEAFRCYCPGRGLSSLSLIPTLDVVARGSLSVAEGFKCFLALEQLAVSFHEELHLAEKWRADAEAQLKQIKHAMVHLSTEKRKTDET